MCTREHSVWLASVTSWVPRVPVSALGPR
jgi:hypothetical protein